MKTFLKGMILGGLLVYIGMSLAIQAQVEEPLTLRVPPIATDDTWTPDQQMELRKMFNDLATQQNTVNRSFAGRMRQID